MWGVTTWAGEGRPFLRGREPSVSLALILGNSDRAAGSASAGPASADVLDGETTEIAGGWGGGGWGVRDRWNGPAADGVARLDGVGRARRGIELGGGPRRVEVADGVEQVDGARDDDDDADVSGSCELAADPLTAADGPLPPAPPPTRRMELTPLSSARTSCWWPPPPPRLPSEFDPADDAVDSGRTPCPPVRCCSRWSARSLADDMGTKPPAVPAPARRGVEGVCGREDEADDESYDEDDDGSEAEADELSEPGGGLEWLKSIAVFREDSRRRHGREKARGKVRARGCECSDEGAVEWVKGC